EPTAAATLARLCGHLPVALRAIAASVAARPRCPLSTVAGQLIDELRRDGTGEPEEAAVRIGLHHLYRTLRGSQDRAEREAARAWLEAERANLLAAVHQAAHLPGSIGRLAIPLGDALPFFFFRRRHWSDCEASGDLMLRLSRTWSDRGTEAHALTSLGIIYSE